MAAGVKWVIANWKSHKTIIESLQWIEVVGPELAQRPDVTVVVCPAYTALSEMRKVIQSNHWPILLGVQNVSPFVAGAYTGEVAAELLNDLAALTIIGHSERRKSFGETDQLVATKAQLARQAGLQTLICVQGSDTPIPADVTLVAYEPPGAISTDGGHPDTPESAAEVAALIRQRVRPDLPVIYGGSVDADNAKQYLTQPGLDGVLVGAASLDPQEFITIIQQWT